MASESVVVDPTEDGDNIAKKTPGNSNMAEGFSEAASEFMAIKEEIGAKSVQPEEPKQSSERSVGPPMWHDDPRFDRFWQHYREAMSVVNSDMDNASGGGEETFPKWCLSMMQYHMKMARRMQAMASYYSQWYRMWADHATASGPRGNQAKRRMHQKPYPSSGVVEKPKEPDSSECNIRQDNSMCTNQEAHSQDSCGEKPETKRSRSKRGRKKTRSRRKKRKKQNSVSSAGNSAQRLVDPDEEFEMHITPEMIEFFKISAKHKLERGKYMYFGFIDIAIR